MRAPFGQPNSPEEDSFEEWGGNVIHGSLLDCVLEVRGVRLAECELDVSRSLYCSADVNIVSERIRPWRHDRSVLDLDIRATIRCGVFPEAGLKIDGSANRSS
jgi:hypothetical protein